MAGEPIIVKIISESVGGGKEAKGGFLDGLSMNSPVSLLRGILGKLSVASLVAGPMLYFTKKIAENSELQKGFKKAIDAVFAEYGDIGIWLAWSVKSMADDMGGIPKAIGEELELLFTGFPIMYAQFWVDSFQSLGNMIGTAFDTAITNLTNLLFGDSTKNETEEESSSGAGKGGGALKDWLMGQWWSFRKIFGVGPGPAIPVTSMFSFEGEKLAISDALKMPDLKIGDLFKPNMSLFDLRPWFALPNFNISNLFEKPIIKMELGPQILLPKFKVSDLFDFTTPDNSNKKLGLVEAIKSIVYDAIDDILPG